GYSMKEVLYKPHNIVRHPDMPKAVFKLLWEYIKNKNEIFAFVKNKTKSGDYYWVFANITVSLNEKGEAINCYSVRRAPNKDALKTISELYKNLVECEQKDGLQASYKKLQDFIASYNISYNQLIFELQGLK
ncbi:PAS domain-containing protein, partial [Campylobacter jejuni]|nr:PAS domain-containing protein [Campylobacter jejuni]